MTGDDCNSVIIMEPAEKSETVNAETESTKEEISSTVSYPSTIMPAIRAQQKNQNIEPKLKKKVDKQKKKDPRSWENTKKVLSELPTPDERLKCLEERYKDVYADYQAVNFNMEIINKTLANQNAEREKEQNELAKAILAKGRLENLCRELQKQNKAIRDENIQRLKDEEEKRREVANTFTERLNTLTALINESKDKSNKVKEENQSMSERLTELYKQYTDREKQLEHRNRQVDLQKELYDTTVKQHEMILQSERAQFEQQQKCSALEIAKKDHHIHLLEQTSKDLQKQLDVYKNQYSEIESTMSKSTIVFDNFKDEMAKMKRELRTLERERDHWMAKWQKTTNHFIAFSESYSEIKNELSGQEKKLAAMQNLCRTLNTERNQYISQLKENNIEPMTPPVLETPELDQTEPKSSSTQIKETVKLRRELNKMKEELREMSRADTMAKEKLSQKEETLLNLKEDLAKMKLQNTGKFEEGECSHSSGVSSGKIKRPRKAKGKGKGEATLPVASASNGATTNGLGNGFRPSGSDAQPTNSTADDQNSLDEINLDRLSSVDSFESAFVDKLLNEGISLESFPEHEAALNGNDNVSVASDATTVPAPPPPAVPRNDDLID